jgi:hypothetical protein
MEGIKRFKPRERPKARVVPHVLLIPDYQTTDDADYDSWLLLEATPAAITEPTTAMDE